MALPKLNDSPQYELTIPSMGKTVKFRPFLVKEEKVMMMAMESENQKDILNTIVNTIDACVSDSLDSSKLTTFDVEFMFLKIRAKSVGETSKLGFKCKECEHPNDISINIDTIEIELPQVENVIKLNDSVQVELSWPSFHRVVKDNIVDASTSVDQIFGLIRSCIVSISTNEERFAAADHSREELDAFIESMNGDQFAKLRNYVEKMPRLTHDVEFDCEKCAHHNNVTIEGMQNFFS